MAHSPFGRRPVLVKPLPDSGPPDGDPPDDHPPGGGAAIDGAANQTIETLRRRGRWLITSGLTLDGCTVDHVVIAPGAVLAVSMTNAGAGERGHQKDPDSDALGEAERGAQVIRLLLRAGDLQDRCEVIPTLIVCAASSPGPATGSSRAGSVWVLDGTRPQLWVDFVELDLLAPHLRTLLHETFQAARAAQSEQRVPPVAQHRQERGAA